MQRCLDTLFGAGWIDAAPDPATGARSAWTLSERVGRLGPADSFDLVELARPITAGLSASTGEAVHLVALDGSDVVLLDRTQGSGPVQVVVPAGHRVPAYAAATGKAMLAALAPADRDRHLPSRLQPLTSQTITTRSALRAELDEIRARSWAANQGEWESSVAAVAAAIVTDDAVVGALSVSSTPDRLPADRIAQIAPRVVSAAREIATIIARRTITSSRA